MKIKPEEDLKIKPDPEDFERIEREHGRPSPTDAAMAKHYQLAQAAKMIRLYEQGRLAELLQPAPTVITLHRR
jgi:hypothetical protein